VPRRSAADSRRRAAVGVAFALALVVSGCDGPSPSAASAAPSAGEASPSAPTPVAEPSVPPAIPDGTYVQIAPITRAEAIANGLRSADVRENLGRFTLELRDGAFTLTQRAPEPVEFPLILGAYAWTASGLVLTPSTFRGQVWTLHASSQGDRVRFRVVETTSSSIPPRRVSAGVTTIFATHPWVLRR
jgi:hypothetical protein